MARPEKAQTKRRRPSQGENSKAKQGDKLGPAASLAQPPGPMSYNFRRPNKFSKDHIRSIESVHENYSRFATNFLAGQIRSVTHVDLVHLEQSTFGEYVDQLPFPTVLFVSELDPLGRPVVIQLDIDLAFAIIDRMLGGTGASKHGRTSAGVTEIEMLLFEDLGKGLFTEFTSAWEQVAKLQAGRCDVAMAPHQVQGLLTSEVALIIQHQVRLLNVTGSLSICLPASTLEPLMPRLNARLLFANPHTPGGDEAEQSLTAQIEQVMLPVSVRLGSTTIRVSDLLSLDIGDVVRLDAAVRSPLPVMVEKRPCFLAYPGQHANHLTVKITECIEETGQNMAKERGSESHE